MIESSTSTASVAPQLLALLRKLLLGHAVQHGLELVDVLVDGVDDDCSWWCF